MKRIITISILILVFITGCETYPYADFWVDYRYVQPYEVVNFYNQSEDASSFRWDFGDGTISTQRNPSHVYSAEGTYTVTLTAYSHDNNIDRASITIEVYYTELEITVAEWNPAEVVEYIVPGASVRLYPTLDDWDYETNMVAEGYTDNNGIVVFINLQPQRYYVDVWHPDYNNFQLREDDPWYITTPVLEVAMVNTFLAWADYYPSVSSKRDRDIINTHKINVPKRTFKERDVSK